jgi:hypothetical protein
VRIGWVVTLSHDLPQRIRHTFLALILAQATHSIEEYIFRLFDVLTLARLVSELISSDRAVGFAVANAALFLIGLGCYVGSVRRGTPSARAIAWSWASLEFANGIAHIALAWSVRGYFPGVATAPILLALSSYLLVTLARSRVGPHRAASHSGCSTS